MNDYATQMQNAHALNLYYFETMLMLIVILWLLKWMFAYNPAAQPSADY